MLNADGNGNPRYTLHWNFSVAEETITFAVNVSTNGWVGFGISPNGGMTNSDVVIGWVNDDGQTFFHVSCSMCKLSSPQMPINIIEHGFSAKR